MPKKQKKEKKKEINICSSQSQNDYPFPDCLAKIVADFSSFIFSFEAFLIMIVDSEECSMVLKLVS